MTLLLFLARIQYIIYQHFERLRFGFCMPVRLVSDYHSASLSFTRVHIYFTALGVVGAGGVLWDSAWGHNTWQLS